MDKRQRFIFFETNVGPFWQLLESAKRHFVNITADLINYLVTTEIMHGENQFGNNFTQYDSFCRFQLGITIYFRISKTGTPSLLKKDHRSKRPVPPPRTQKIAGRLIWNIQHYYVDICIFWLFSNIVTLLARQQVTRSYNPVILSAIYLKLFNCLCLFI